MSGTTYSLLRDVQRGKNLEDRNGRIFTMFIEETETRSSLVETHKFNGIPVSYTKTVKKTSKKFKHNGFPENFNSEPAIHGFKTINYTEYEIIEYIQNGLRNNSVEPYFNPAVKVYKNGQIFLELLFKEGVLQVKDETTKKFSRVLVDGKYVPIDESEELYQNEIIDIIDALKAYTTCSHIYMKTCNLDNLIGLFNVTSLKN